MYDTVADSFKVVIKVFPRPWYVRKGNSEQSKFRSDWFSVRWEFWILCFCLVYHKYFLSSIMLSSKATEKIKFRFLVGRKTMRFLF